MSREKAREGKSKRQVSDSDGLRVSSAKLSAKV